VEPYLPTVALLVLGLLALVAVLVPALRAVRRFAATAARANARVADGTGLLRARYAALGVAIRGRRRVRIESDLARVPSGEPAQTGDGSGQSWSN
jgi:hypothetical protein